MTGGFKLYSRLDSGRVASGQHGSNILSGHPNPRNFPAFVRFWTADWLCLFPASVKMLQCCKTNWNWLCVCVCVCVWGRPRERGWCFCAFSSTFWSVRGFVEFCTQCTSWYERSLALKLGFTSICFQQTRAQAPALWPTWEKFANLFANYLLIYLVCFHFLWL